MDFLVNLNIEIILTRSIHLILHSTGCNLFVTFLDPSWIQKSNAHVFLDFGSRNFFASDRRYQILLVDWLHYFLGLGIVFPNLNVARAW